MTNPLDDPLKDAQVTMTDFSGLAEAPASATVKVKVQGFEVLYTIRGWDELDVEARMVAMLRRLGDNGAEPVVRPAPAVPNAEGELQFVCPKFMLERRPDGKLKLHLFTTLGDGTVSRYPEVYHMASKEAMWEMIGDVASGFDFTELPVEYECSWRIFYKLGRETPKGGKYKDLLRVELA